jgi:hypothetical protein
MKVELGRLLYALSMNAALKARQVAYDDLHAVILQEDVGLGVQTNHAQNILKPSGDVFFTLPAQKIPTL